MQVSPFIIPVFLFKSLLLGFGLWSLVYALRPSWVSASIDRILCRMAVGAGILFALIEIPWWWYKVPVLPQSEFFFWRDLYKVAFLLLGTQCLWWKSLRENRWLRAMGGLILIGLVQHVINYKVTTIEPEGVGATISNLSVNFVQLGVFGVLFLVVWLFDKFSIGNSPTA